MAIDLTADGRLTVDPRVTERGLLRMSEMVKGAKLGGYAGERARTDLKETLSTSDAPFAFTHLVNLRNLPQYDEIIPDFSPIVTDELVPDFEPATFFAIEANFDNLKYGKDNDGQLGIAPKVAELDTYQYAFGYTQESTDIAVEKRGFKVGWSLEKGLNNVFSFVSSFPGAMLKVGVKTDAYVVFRALTKGVTAASELAAGTDIVTGEDVPADAPASPAALRVALRQIGQRTDSRGRRVPVPARFRLVVAQGAADSINWNLALARGLFSVDDGAIQYRPGAVADPLSRITGVIETEWIDDDAWYLVPESGTTDKPALIRVQLTGYTSPEVYVSNFNGAPLGGGSSANPFQAYSFDNDAIDLKFRQFTNAGLFSEDAVVWSDGTGTVTP